MMDTAIVVLVPEAEAVVGGWRARYAPEAAFGMASHVTLLYPFLPIVTDADASALAEIARGIEQFDLTFENTSRFGEDLLFLDPKPDDDLRTLIQAIATRFGILPYEGTIPIDEVKPHLTIVDAMNTDADVAVMDEVDRDVSPRLPVRAKVAEMVLMERAEFWRVVRRFPFGRG